MWRDKRAVSPAVGTILMVAITILLATSLYIWVNSLQPEKVMPIGFETDVIEVNGYDVLTISPVAAPSETWSDLQFVVGNHRLTLDIHKRIMAGDTVYIYNDGHTLKITTSIDEVEKNVKDDIAQNSITVKIVNLNINTVVYEKTIFLN